MKKINLKLFEFYSLDAEINGLVNPVNGEKLASGLLNEKLPLVIKYWMSDLGKKVAAEKAVVEELKNELIKKFGKPSGDGNVSIPMYAASETGEKLLNENYQQFETEFNSLLQTEKELEYMPFKLTDFAQVETSENFQCFYKLIAVEQIDAVNN